ncbi:hypothetical protein GCM10027275_54460 [Rhabdobacter roseus]|uniref:CRISPR-associated endoribonuclease Cas2 n=1 Tax=Rhabdobacter roseus TaxID=1655419 RepID=A0A840U5W1_9BACT|nr:CRISPR-associated endonuclease Cas2 [Rhabdobacter roseus]MBB5287460.1 CRISPR-associated protein Cas2 [Rhabdobacter roseus]
MPRSKKSSALTPSELNQLWEQATLPYQLETPAAEPTLAMPEGIRLLYKTLHTTSKRPEEMYCFIMYDIESNKVRRLVAKYLEKKGCQRVQKSVFFARLHRHLHRDIADTLRQIQEAYQNHDSILILPVGEDMLNKLNCIGKDFEWEVLTASRHTLFF